MTKRKQQSLNIDVKGLSTNQILNMDVNEINSMNYRTIRALASRLVSSMNKRIRQLRRTTPDSLALHSLPENYQFSTKGLNRNEIRSLVGQMQQFGQMKTSTVKGWKDYRKNIEAKLGGKLSDLPDESNFWEMFRNLKDSNHAIFQKMSSDEILKVTYDEYIENPEDPMSSIQERLDDLYEIYEGNFMEDDIWGDDEDEDSF